LSFHVSPAPVHGMRHGIRVTRDAANKDRNAGGAELPVAEGEEESHHLTYLAYMYLTFV
jgi:hypothetical protein